MRFVAGCLRLIGFLLLAAGTVLAVGDVARSLASNNVRLMSISQTMALAGLSTPFDAPPQAGATFTGATPGTLKGEIGRQPASVVAGLAGIVFLAAGRAPASRRSGASARKV